MNLLKAIAIVGLLSLMSAESALAAPGQAGNGDGKPAAGASKVSQPVKPTQTGAQPGAGVVANKEKEQPAQPRPLPPSTEKGGAPEASGTEPPRIVQQPVVNTLGSNAPSASELVAQLNEGVKTNALLIGRMTSTLKAAEAFYKQLMEDKVASTVKAKQDAKQDAEKDAKQDAKQRDWLPFGVIALLVLIGLVPAILACCLVFKLYNNGVVKQSKEEEERKGSSDLHNGDDAQDGKPRVDEELKKMMENISKSVAGLSASVASLKQGAAITQEFSSLRKQQGESFASLKQELCRSVDPIAKNAERANNDLNTAVGKLSAAVDSLSFELGEHVKEYEGKLAEVGRRENTLALREQTAEAAKNAAVQQTERKYLEQYQVLCQKLADSVESSIKVRVDERVGVAIKQKDEEFAKKEVLLKAAFEKSYADKVAELQKGIAERDAQLQEKESQLVSARNDANVRVNQVEENLSRRMTEMEQQHAIALAAKDDNLAAEKAAHGTTQAKLAETENQLQQRTAALQNTCHNLETLQGELAALEKSLYPAEFVDKQEFAPFKAQLADWSAKHYAGAEIARSAIGLFAARRSVAEDTWTLALRDIAVGVSKALREDGVDVTTAAAELSRWAQFMSTFSDSSPDDPYYFQLNVPAVGGVVDSSWMKQTNSSQVKAVHGWAVFTAMGLRYMADIA